MATRLPLGASRVFHRAPDGTVPYFRSEGGMQEEGRLPEGADPAQLLSQGYVEADRDTFLEARTRLDPLRPVPTSAPEATVHLPGRGRVRMDTADAHAYADETDAALASMASPAPVPDSPEDVDALGSAFDEAYAPGLARQQAALEAATAPTPRTASARAPRRPEYDVERVPSTVPLASRLGGEPLPGPQRVAASPEQETPQQGPTLGESDTLEDAQKRERLMRGIAGMARGSSRIGAAIAGIRPEEGAAADLERSAGSQVRDYLMRRQQSEADRASAEQAALRDPTSPASQRFQAYVQSAFGSVYTPEQIKGMTPADAPLVSRYGEMVRTLEDRAAGRAAEQEAQQAQLTARATEAEKQRAFEGRQGAASRANAREIAGMRQEQAGDKASERAGVTAFRNESSLRKELASNPATKNFQDVAVSFDKVQRAAQDPSAAGDLSLIFGYMKMLDPGSTVREGEFANAQNAGGVGDRIANTYNKIISGERLTTEQRSDFVRQARAAYEAQKAAYERIAEQYRGIASASGVSPERVTLPVGAEMATPPGSPPPRRRRDAQGRVWEEQPDGSARMVL